MNTPSDSFHDDDQSQPELTHDEQHGQAPEPEPEEKHQFAASEDPRQQVPPQPDDEQRRQSPPAAGPASRPYRWQAPHPEHPYPQAAQYPRAPYPRRQQHPPGPAARSAAADPPSDQTEVIEFFTDRPTAQNGPNTADPLASDTPPSFGASPDAPTIFQPSADGGYGPDRRDMLVTRRRRSAANSGWRKVVSKMTAGQVNPGPSAKQERADELIKRIRSSLIAVHKVAFINAKGGVGKTTLAVGVGNAVARERGDRVIAVDVDTDLGNLSRRFSEHGGPQANIEELASMQSIERYSNVRVHTVQNSDRLEMLGAQNDPRSSYTLNGQDYVATIKILETHYNVVLLDCGSSITSPLFSTILSDVTGLVVVAAQNTNGVDGAWSTLHWLHAHGFGRLLQRTVVALNATDRGTPLIDLDAVETELRENVPEVIRVPYDPHLAEGLSIEFDLLKPRTRRALMDLAGAVAEHYPARQVPRHHPGDSGSF
jgi:MinD-like ATPase involved in chromosome partitioning or flagellar assembly